MVLACVRRRDRLCAGLPAKPLAAGRQHRQSLVLPVPRPNHTFRLERASVCRTSHRPAQPRRFCFPLRSVPIESVDVRPQGHLHHSTRVNVHPATIERLCTGDEGRLRVIQWHGHAHHTPVGEGKKGPLCARRT